MQRKVTIKAIKNGSKIDFEMEEKQGVYTELLVFNKTKDNIKKTDSYEIIFTLKNENGAALAFVQDKDEVIYVSKGSDTHLPKCPKDKNGNPNTPFSVTSVQPLELKVHNPDDDINFYKFVLNFVDSAGKAHAFDPIFGNQNGGLTVTPPSSGTSSTVAFVGGTLLGAAAMALAFKTELLG